MGTEHCIERSLTASTRYTVFLQKVFAYIRYKSSQKESTLQTEQTATLVEGNRIVSLLGCKIEVEDVEDG
jgi:hypothetical protein